MKVKGVNYSYNRFYMVYRVEIEEYGKWRKCAYDKKSFHFLIDNGLKTDCELRNYKYRPYILYVVKWFFMKLWAYIKILNPKASKIIGHIKT